MFCYTEMGFFGAGEDGSNEPSIGNVYFRSMGIYGRETTSRRMRMCPRQLVHERRVGCQVAELRGGQ